MAKRIINISLFVIIIVTFSATYLLNYKSSQLPLGRGSVEITFKDNSVIQMEMIEVYGLVQKILGKRAIENFTLYKNDYEKIVSPKAEKNADDIDTDIQQIAPIFNYLEEREIPYYYVTSLLPIVDESDLPLGVEDYSDENAEVLLQKLQELQIPVIDLRKKKQIASISKERLFYRTDHHWSLQTCFAAFQEIIWQIDNDLSWKLDSSNQYANRNFYKEYVDTDSFLGSYGIKVGKYYAGKDDFYFLYPTFENEFLFEAYDAEHNMVLQKSGRFEEALLDRIILEDDSYNNKYNAFSNNSAIENRITNLNSENDKKVLLISHSYGRPLAQYLSLCFREVRYLDPQKGRFCGNYLDYIDEYHPDIVLFLVEFEGEIIGIYSTER